jgi:hypothetical protein
MRHFNRWEETKEFKSAHKKQAPVIRSDIVQVNALSTPLKTDQANKTFNQGRQGGIELAFLGKNNRLFKFSS